MPHNWEARLLFEETTQTLLCGDLFSHVGRGPAITSNDIIEAAVTAEGIFHSTSSPPSAASILCQLADLAPTTLALMHGSSFSGDGSAALLSLAETYDSNIEGRAADTPAENKDIVRRYLQQDEQGFPEPELVLSPTFSSHSSSSDETIGVGPFLQWARSLRDGLHPQVTIDDMVAEEDRVAVRVTWRGRHANAFAGMAPTGRDFRVSGIGIFRVSNGKVDERWLEFDQTWAHGTAQGLDADTTEAITLSGGQMRQRAGGHHAEAGDFLEPGWSRSTALGTRPAAPWQDLGPA